MNKYETWNKLKEPPPVVDDAGNKYWCNKEGEFHRVLGPAIIRKNGSEEWRINGTLHRIGGPAVTSKKGLKARYWIDGMPYATKKEYNEQIRNME